MSSAVNRPRGRRPGHDDTRGTIRAAAARLFEAHGYDAVSLRAVAREASVDPALVHHYFSGKADLYCQAAFGVTWDIDDHVRAVLRGDRDQVGRRAARSFLDHWDANAANHAEYLSSMTRGAGRGRHALTEMIGREVFAPIAATFGHTNALYRGQLAAAAMLGIMVARHELEMPLLASLSLRALATPLGVTLHHYLVESW